MYLDIEEIPDLLTMFKGKEAETTVFIGQLNLRSETAVEMMVVASVRFIGYDDNTVIRYKESCGVAEIPNEQLKANPKTKWIVEEQEAVFAKLEHDVQTKKDQLEAQFKGLGFTIYHGVWVKER